MSHERNISIAKSNELRLAYPQGIPSLVVPEATRTIFPHEVPAPQPTRRNVLNRLSRVEIGNFQEQAGYDLVDIVAANREIGKVVFMGLPGVGKSTVIEQFIDALFEKKGEELQIKITTFDPVFRKMLKYAPREFWEKYHWAVINDSLIITSLRHKRQVDKARRTHPAREVELIEVPFVGTNDRGKSMVKEYWEAAMEKDKSGSMLFVPILEAHGKLTQQEGAKVARREIILKEVEKATTIDQKIQIFARNGIEIAIQAIKKSKKKVQAIIDTLMSQLRNSANIRQAEVVRQEFRKEMKEMVPSSITPELKRMISLPSIEGNIDEMAIKREIFYWERVFDEMGVPTANRFIMLNQKAPVIYRRPDLFEKAA